MDSILAYFNGEKLQCTIGAIISLVFIACSVYFLFQQKIFLKGMAYSAIPLSTLLLIICVGVILRTPNDINRVSSFYMQTPSSIQTEEIPRMEKVMTSFGIIKKVEIAFFVVGLVLIALFWNNELIRGIGVGIIVLSISLYAFDHIAEARGEIYIQFLKAL